MSGERFSSGEHWILMTAATGITGCRCGFVASDDDHGFGDSVVDHIAERVRRETAEEIIRQLRAAGWSAGSSACAVARSVAEGRDQT